MRPATLIVCLCFVAPTSIAMAQHRTHGSATQPIGEPVNAMCPIGKEPIVPSAGTVVYKGAIIALCCPGCGDQFLAWDEARRDEFVAMAVAHSEPGTDRGHGPTLAPGESSPGPTYPYSLPDCPIGGPLGSMGDPIVMVYDNREVRFCCAGCISGFEANKQKYWSEIDARLVEQQVMHYPINICIVTGEELGGEAVNHIHNNRLVRLADAEAVAAFEADPASYLGALDKRIVETQLPGYPTATCLVGSPLGSMGEPVNFIYMNRLVRLCCSACEQSLLDDPAKYMAQLDDAYAEFQQERYPIDTCVVAGGRLGSMGEPVEIVAGTRLVRLCCEGCVPKFKAEPWRYLSGLPHE